VVDVWTNDARGVTCEDMVDTRHSNHLVALLSVYTPYVTIDFERCRLIGSEVLYTEVCDNWKWTYASAPPSSH